MALSWRELSREPRVYVSKPTRQDEFRTPPDVFETLNRRFNFNIDAAATSDNALCKFYFTEEDSALADRPWKTTREKGRIFCHAPPGMLSLFLDRADFELKRDNAEIVVFFLPAETNARWWHKWVMDCSVFLFRGHLREPDTGKNWPKPMAVVVMRPERERQFHRWEEFYDTCPIDE